MRGRDLTWNVENVGRRKWRLVVNLPAIAGGDGDPVRVRKVKRVSADGKRDAESKAARWAAEIATHGNADPETITVAELVARWLDDVKWNVRPATLHFYERTTRLHVLPVLGDRSAASVTAADLSRLYVAKRDAGLAESSVHHVHASVRACWRWALGEDLVERNPADRVKRPPRQVREERQVWSQETVARAAVAADGLVVGVPLVLAAWCGMRRGEVCGLRWHAVDLDNGLAAVFEVLEQTKAGALHHEEPKTAHGKRVVPLTSTVVEILRRHKARQDEYKVARGGAWNSDGYVVCRQSGEPLKPDNLSSAWSSFVRSRGLPPISYHDLRHTYATNLFASAERPEAMLKVVQDLLGHAHASTTADIYLHATDGARELAVAELEDEVAAAMRDALRDSAQERHHDGTTVVDLAERRAKKPSK